MPQSLLGFSLLQESGQAGPSGFLAYVPLLAVFAVVYFLLIRPQARERQRIERETQELLSSLKQGDKVITTGGIYGTILAVRDDTVQLKIADAVKIEVLRTSIARRQAETGQAAEVK
jgi:preprotein translocase subunit YajC